MASYGDGALAGAILAGALILVALAAVPAYRPAGVERVGPLSRSNGAARERLGAIVLADPPYSSTTVIENRAM